MSYLLDTNVISEVRKRHADPHVITWIDQQPEHTLYLSVVTIFEIERGIARLDLRDPSQAKLLTHWFEAELLPAFAHRILPLDLPVMRRAARLHIPDPRPESDAYIAATALVNNLTVITRNTRDFQPMSVPLYNPWTGD